MVRSAICCAFTYCGCAVVTTHGNLVLPHSRHLNRMDGAAAVAATRKSAPSTLCGRTRSPWVVTTAQLQSVKAQQIAERTVANLQL